MVIGVGAYVVWDRTPNTIEYHTREYSSAQKWTKADDLIDKHAPNRLRSAVLERKWKRMEEHRRALVKLGYLQESTVVVSNMAASQVMAKVFIAMGTNNPHALDEEFFSFEADSFATNVLKFVAVTQDVSRWMKLIREADVPEK